MFFMREWLLKRVYDKAKNRNQSLVVYAQQLTQFHEDVSRFAILVNRLVNNRRREVAAGDSGEPVNKLAVKCDLEIGDRLF
ncbi:hypothetical protein L596_000420 [Steinernema carpocapsae]|uniref:Uncharacterized protein n=1 Tax=Steinernema carpocapsae TaxID=34508 RepID=A0A4U8UIY2_STECR|nr:hypothetical protein L596_000420 [Steinernema carpocapsae]